MINLFTGSAIGLIGGLIGCLLGITGGAVGTYFSIKNTGGPLERGFMVRTAIAAWISILVFLFLLVFLPIPYNFISWVPYGVLLPMGIRYVNQRQLQIQRIEASAAEGLP